MLFIATHSNYKHNYVNTYIVIKRPWIQTSSYNWYQKLQSNVQKHAITRVHVQHNQSEGKVWIEDH